MPARYLAAAVGAALAVAAGVISVTVPADAAIPAGRLFFHSANGSYQDDAAADPSAGPDDRNPEGATTDAVAPTKTTDATATWAPTPVAVAGGPAQPTFSFAVSGSVTSICLDAWFQGESADGTLVVRPFINTPEAFVRFADIEVAGYTGELTRVTALAKYESPQTIPADSEFGFSAYANVNPDLTMVYDSVAHPSNVTVNPTGACTPFSGGGAAPAPTGGASESASAAPSESAAASTDPSAAPSESGSPDPSPTQPAPSCAPASPSPAGSPSGEPSVDPSADPSAEPSASAVAAPKLPPGGSATPSASAAPSESAEPSADPSADPSPTGGGNDDACAAGSITLATNATRITAGNAPTLSGVVRNFRGDAVRGVTVTIYVRGYGDARYTTAATVRTDSAGRFTIQVRPMKLSAFVAGVGERRSPTLAIRVNTRMEITSPRASATVANPVTFTGRMTPGYARVAVGLGYLANGRFVVLTQVNTSGTGTYSITARLPRGTYPFVVFTSAHQGTDKGSRSVRLTVR